MSDNDPKKLPTLERTPKQFLNKAEKDCESGSDVQNDLTAKADALLSNPDNSGLVLASHCSHGSHGSHGSHLSLIHI